MKCPACGFDSPDDAGWCDFCKEPFRKKAAPAPAPAPAAGPPEASKVSIDKLVRLAAAPVPAPEAKSVELPPEFASLDAGERIPIAPSWARAAAWAFLGLWLIFGMTLLGYYAGKQRVRSPAVTSEP